MQYSVHFWEEPNWESGHLSPPFLFCCPIGVNGFKLAPKWCWKILFLHKQIRNFSTATWASFCRLISAFFEHKFQGHSMKLLQLLKWSMKLLDNETFQNLRTWIWNKVSWDPNQGVMSWGVWHFEIGGFLWALKIQLSFSKGVAFVCTKP